MPELMITAKIDKLNMQTWKRCFTRALARE